MTGLLIMFCGLYLVAGIVMVVTVVRNKRRKK